MCILLNCFMTSKMFKEQFISEANFYFRKKWFYGALLLFPALGYLLTYKATLSFPGLYVNSPYVLTYVIGLISLINIFTITIFSAQIILREKDADFDTILYATPINKMNFLLSRYSLILIITLLSYFLFILGFMTGHLIQGNDPERFRGFRFINYLYPFLILVLPNAVFCTAIVSMAGLLSKSKMFIYLAGLFTYILYMVVSMFSNSPLFANASPASGDTVALMAIIDPFGLAAFFEQTKQWSPGLRNTQLVQLQGNLLFNRIAVILVSCIFLFITYKLYRFSIGKKEYKRRNISAQPVMNETITYNTLPNTNYDTLYIWRSFWSYVKLDTRSIIRSIPFILIVVMWTFFLGMEVYSEIDAGIRMPQRFASTGLMVKNIMGNFPFFILVVLLFYGVEMLWRSKNVNIDMLENSTPVNTTAILAAKCVSLFIVTILLIVFSIVLGVVLQNQFKYPRIEWGLYTSLFYVLGVPAFLGAGIVISIMAIVRNKYPGLVLGAIFLLVSNSFVGNMLGLQHPLFRFANFLPGNYSDMNGFGAYLEVFGVKMLYWTAFTVIVGLLASHFWAADKSTSLLKRMKQLKLVGWIVIVFCFTTFLGSGITIMDKTGIEPWATKADWQQKYELSYRKYQQLHQPTITDVKTIIELFPEKNSYTIKGEYVVINKNNKALDSFLLYCKPVMTIKEIKIENTQLKKSDAAYGHYSYQLLKPLQPGDSISMQFNIEYRWSPYKRHDPVNAIIENGSFMRISRYYPVFGYQPDIELEDESERVKRKMGAATALKKLEETDSAGYDYSFINLDAIISTTENQTAIGTGELVRNWTENGRSYFQYKSLVPIPFRFAVSSAKYAVKKSSQNGIAIEIYYHPAHSENVAHLTNEVKNTIAYCENNFGPFPFKSVRFAEISGFTEGFAATSYPATIFMNENMGFHADLRGDNENDVINELAGHELSHEWWGNNQIAPDQREGSAMLTETLAMYSELMLYKQSHGVDAMKQVVSMHQSIYENGKVYSTEEPLYRVHPGNVYLSYNKGLVAMHQLYELIGEKKINLALQHFLSKYAFPNKPPTTIDLINEFLKVSDTKIHDKINMIFR